MIHTPYPSSTADVATTIFTDLPSEKPFSYLPTAIADWAPKLLSQIISNSSLQVLAPVCAWSWINVPELQAFTAPGRRSACIFLVRMLPEL
jgi:hypothetical protein